MKPTYSFAILVLSLFTGSFSQACDAYLARNASDSSIDARTRGLYARDCAIQDRYTAIRNEMQTRYSVPIADLAEYKVLRFINRKAWETAKTNQTKPNQIFQPAPITWNIWNGGLNGLFPKASNKNQLSQRPINNELFSLLNRVLLTDGRNTLKDTGTDENKLPGEFRIAGDNSNVAFCDKQNLDYSRLVDVDQVSLAQVQKRWERATGLSFENVLKKENQTSFAPELMGALMRPLGPGCGGDPSSYVVSYVRADQVMDHISRLKIFVKSSLNSYQQQKAPMPPIEFSAFVQRWFVTIHPFADGNGRTSRALQDLILENFDLPFAATGDLTNDVLDEYESYIQRTYQKTEAMLDYLDGCLNELRAGGARSFACRTTAELNLK